MKKKVQIKKMCIIDIGYSTKVLAADGSETAKLVAAGSNRQYVTIDQIPENLQHAVVAIEDERFYDHNGIDLKGIVRALVADVRTRDCLLYTSRLDYPEATLKELGTYLDPPVGKSGVNHRLRKLAAIAENLI